MNVYNVKNSISAYQSCEITIITSNMANYVSQIRNLVNDTLTPVNNSKTEYPFILIVGERGEGKTTFVQNLVNTLNGTLEIGLGGNSEGMQYTIITKLV